MMFAMDCAAMTETDVSNFIKNTKNRTILISNILSRYPVSAKESPCSWIALEEARHFLRYKSGAATGSKVISSDCDLRPKDSALVCDYSP